MNEHLKELEPQCWEYNEFGLTFNYEKFADLIIRECAGLCNDPVVVLQHWGLDSKSE